MKNKIKIFQSERFNRDWISPFIMTVMLLMLSISFTSNAQNYFISFSAKGNVGYLDSIIAENLNKGTSVTLQGTEILHLFAGGINDLKTVYVYPNPMQGQSEITFFSKETGNAKVSIYAVNGQELLKAENFLEQGIHTYQVSGLSQGVYFINITGDNYFYTTRLVSQYSNRIEPRLSYFGSKKSQLKDIELRNSGSAIDMAYTSGDKLRFTGFSGINISPITDIPSSSKTIPFDFTSIKTSYFRPVSWICGDDFIVSHLASGNVAPINKSVTYGTVLTNLTGSDKCWITRNLGASQQATSATDISESSAGWYWQFNHQQGFMHDGTNRTPGTSWIYPMTPTQNFDWETGNDPCSLELGSGWRIPTLSEWNNADINGAWNNYNDCYSSVLKLHAARSLDYITGTLNSTGDFGAYWSTSNDRGDYGDFLYFDNGWSNILNNYSKSYGFPLRCLSDNCTPTKADADSDQVICHPAAIWTTTLSGNIPSVGTGEWSIISGNGGNITDIHNPTSTFDGITGSSYTLRWTISNPPCEDSYDDVTITSNITPTDAKAGTDLIICSTIITLTGNTPLVGNGVWSIVSGIGGSIASPNSPTTSFTAKAGETYTLRWSILNPPCTSYDDVTISSVLPYAGPDQNTCAAISIPYVGNKPYTTLAGNTTILGKGVWSIVSGAGGSVKNINDPSSIFTGTAGTTYILRWTLINTPCNVSYDEVKITFRNWSCGCDLTVNHSTGNGVAPVDKTVTYGTLGSSSQCWISSNLGADHQATAYNDATEASAGWYWQFNTLQGNKHDGINRTPNTNYWQPVINANLDWEIANDPCYIELGSGWRIPTFIELYTVYYMNPDLKMHAAGRLSNSVGSLNDRGNRYYYWSSEQDSYSSVQGKYIGSGTGLASSINKAYGFPLRCIKADQ